MANQVNKQSLIPSTDVIEPTLTLKMTTAQVVETSVAVNNSPMQDYIHPDNHVPPTRAVFTWLSKGIGFGFGFGFTTPFGWLVYLLWFWFYDSQVKTALMKWLLGLNLSQ